jgi:molybdopterin molybdotransferase
MISFDDAQNLIAAHLLTLSTTMIPCSNALGMVLAEHVIAPIDLPPFDNAQVDGFAVRTESLITTKSLPIMTTLRATTQKEIALPHHMTAKIMTGAPLPRGADAVVMKEDVEVRDDLTHFSHPVLKNDNIRFCGEDIKKGFCVAAIGSVVTAQLIGVFYGLGICQVLVFKWPKIGIISTGDELIHPGKPLQYGQVYYLVGPMLKAQCRAIGIHDLKLTLTHDNENEIKKAIVESLEQEIVLITGGMSKGDYDFVRPTLTRMGVKEIFYQGAWRPGKPLYFGKNDTTFCFGLPGNPVAVFVCFHIFVRSLIFRAMHAAHLLTPKTAILSTGFIKNPGVTFFARAHVNAHNQLSILEHQGSHQIFTLSLANALACINAEQVIVKAGQIVHYFSI